MYEEMDINLWFIQRVEKYRTIKKILNSKILNYIMKYFQYFIDCDAKIFSHVKYPIIILHTLCIPTIQ